MGLQRDPRIEIAPQPASRRLALPIHWVFRACTFPPAPARLAPEFPAGVAAFLHELQEFLLRHSTTCDPIRPHFNRVRPFLVIENKWLLAGRSQQKATSRYLRVSPQRSRFAGTHRVQP